MLEKQPYLRLYLSRLSWGYLFHTLFQFSACLMSPGVFSSWITPECCSTNTKTSLLVPLCVIPSIFICRFLSIVHRSTILQQQFNRVGQVEHGSVALPGILRSGSVGPETLNMGTMPSPQQQITTGQMHLGHMPPLVSLHIQMLLFMDQLISKVHNLSSSWPHIAPCCLAAYQHQPLHNA